MFDGCFQCLSLEMEEMANTTVTQAPLVNVQRFSGVIQVRTQLSSLPSTLDDQDQVKIKDKKTLSERLLEQVPNVPEDGVLLEHFAVLNRNEMASSKPRNVIRHVSTS